MVNLNGLVKSLWEAWWLLLTAAGMAGLLTYHSVRQTPPTYVATSTLMVGDVLRSPKPGDGEFAVAQNLANGYAQLAQRQPVLDGTVRALNLPYGWDALRSRIVVVHQNGALTIEVRAMDTDPTRARDIAQAVAEQIVAASPTKARQQDTDQHREFARAELADLQAKIDQGRQDAEKKRVALAQETNARAVLDGQDEIKAINLNLTSWRQSYDTLVASLSSQNDPNTLTIIEPAAIPSAPAGPRGLWYVLLASIGGFLIVAAGISAVEFFNDKIRTRDDLPGQLRDGLEGIFTYVPRIRGARGPLAVLSDPDSLAADTYRLLAAQLRFGVLGAGPHLLMVTSATNGEGKSTTAANLAAALALGGTEVLLLDLDLRKPTQHLLFGTTNRAGAAAMLRDGDFAIDRYAMRTTLPHLRLVPAGTVIGNPAEILSRSGEALLLSAWAAADIVIVDGPPLLAVPDAAVLTGFVPDVLCVTRFEQTNGRDLRAALDMLNSLPTRVRGVILNAVPSERAELTGYRNTTPADALNGWRPFKRGTRVAALSARSTKTSPTETGDF
jgi:capsular exopolysaccharide synthesis family protein